MMSLPTRFKAEFKHKEKQPDKPILVGRDLSQARISIDDAKLLIVELQDAVTAALVHSNSLEEW
jgi:hypothetical protein